MHVPIHCTFIDFILYVLIAKHVILFLYCFDLQKKNNKEQLTLLD